MSESNNANKPSLSRLYRRYAGGVVGVAVPDADDLLQLARVAHAEDAASPLYADLLRFSRELEPASAQLSAEVTRAFAGTVPAGHRQARARRAVATGARRWRGVAAIAASLVALIGAWTVFKHDNRAPAASVAQAAAPLVRDRIFAALDDRIVATPARGDEIFRDQFSSDRIFRSNDG